jgi:succinyldiaminopimelate transaminase
VVAALSGQAPGYPMTAGTPELRDACAHWLARTQDVIVSPDAILPVIGSKEFIAQLPTILGFGAENSVSVPAIAYPTYAVGAQIAGSTIRVDDLDADLVWVNSPSNPTGEVRQDWEQLRNRTGIIASDECYLEFGWDVKPVSILHPDVSGGSHKGLIAVHSLSKRSNMAGYRCGFVAGDPDLIARLLEVRKHMGAMVPTPVQRAAVAAWNDDAHVAVQRDRYFRRREIIRDALLQANFVIDHSEAGLYLWATRDEPCWESVAWFAERGILVTPGDFYGTAGQRHIRVAMTATDDDIDEAAARISAP